MIVKKVILSFAFIMSSTAFAFDTGTFACKNGSGIPDDIYKVRSVSIQGVGEDLPFIEVTRHFRVDRSDPNSAIKIATIKGIASFTVSDEMTAMTIGALRLEFVNGKLGTCQKL